MQVGTNGLVSFGSPYTAYSSRTFPITQRVIAPYWNDQDFRSKGSIRYFSVTPTHPTLASTLANASRLISSVNDVNFEASWIFVVRWIDACPLLNSYCTQASSKISTSYTCDNYCEYHTCQLILMIIIIIF